MDQLFAKLTSGISNRPWLSYVFSLLLFLTAMFYMRLVTTSTNAQGHKFTQTAFLQTQIDGKSYYVPIYKDITPK